MWKFKFCEKSPVVQGLIWFLCKYCRKLPELTLIFQALSPVLKSQDIIWLPHTVLTWWHPLFKIHCYSAKSYRKKDVQMRKRVLKREKGCLNELLSALTTFFGSYGKKICKICKRKNILSIVSYFFPNSEDLLIWKELLRITGLLGPPIQGKFEKKKCEICPEG